ncbi:hypothetical protein [Nonomuraea guangzhouensis]|uniref:Uncharacterized protein n=1 Tax=Nonomuraea guangzhouensis TaxID=1291555 RepID=A0ABW4G6D5_9ACTN|nr:hypothetical protein [Nonomuraea guangzhouensis]
MIAVVVSLVAVVLLVLVVVALGMRSMNRRESSLPPERLKQMAEKDERTLTRSTDEFSKSEPRMNNFSPDFSPIDEVKAKPVRTGQRGKRGVDEWGNPHSDVEDEEFWANIRSDAEEGGFGAGGTVAARKGASRPVERPSERPAGRPAEREKQPTAQREQRPAAKRERPAKREPVTADPNAATVQAPLPNRPNRSRSQRPTPAAANSGSSGLADLVESAQRPTPTAAELADQRTVTFSAPTPPDVMSILGVGAQQVTPPNRPQPGSGTGSFPAVGSATSLSTNSPATSSGAFPAVGSGAFPATPASANSGAFPATPATPNSGSFPATPVSPISGAPTSAPFTIYGANTDPLESTWTNPPVVPTASGSWPALQQHDILDDPTPGAPSSDSWPAFEPQQPAAAPRGSYPASYEVRAGWAVADDSDPLTGPSPATGTPTAPARSVSAYDDVLSASPVQPAPFAYETGDITSLPPGQIAQTFAYETGDITSIPPGQLPAGWNDPPAGSGAWPNYGGPSDTGARQGAPGGGQGGGRRRATTPEQEFPDYYR